LTHKQCCKGFDGSGGFAGSGSHWEKGYHWIISYLDTNFAMHLVGPDAIAMWVEHFPTF
jgi:hypothetical protein